MRILRLPSAASPLERGRHHGATLAKEIDRIAAIRSELCRSQGMFRSDDELMRVAELHLPILERYDTALYQELIGIADGAGLPPARIVVVNHYTDLKDLDPAKLFGEGAQTRDLDKEEDCTAIVAGTREGALLGQTWDMHGSAEPFVVMLEVPRTPTTPAAWLLSIAGCLGMAGMNELGVGITINNLKSNDARLGLVWPALVRRVLYERTAARGRDIVTDAPLGSGHHYLVADAQEAFGIETSGTRSEVWARADLTRVGTGFHHENHCLGTRVREVSSISPVSTTLERFAHLEASLGAQPIRDGQDLFARLGSHEGYPRSLCTHLASDAAPHAMKTCAGVLMDLTKKQLFAHVGCLHGVTPTLMPFAL